MRYNPWPEGGRAKTKARRRKKAHSKAGHIGWSYRRDRKRGARSPMRYLAQAGLSRGALKKYRSARKTKPATLLSKRTHRKGNRGKRFITRPFLVNRGRRAGSYARFVKAFSHRSGLSGPALFRAAGRAYRGGGARRNGDPYPMTNNNRKRRGARARRNQIPGLVYYNRKRRKARKGSRRNGVLPYLAFENRGRRGRGRSRRNGVLPYAAFNGRSGSLTAKGIMGSFTDAFETIVTPDFWTGNVIPLGAGYIGAQFAGSMIYAFAEKTFGQSGPVVRIGATAVGAAVLSGIALLATKKADIATKVLAGGLVAVFAAILNAIVGAETYAKMTGMSGFGGMAANLTEELKSKIAQSVQNEIANAEGRGGAVSAFVSTQDLQVSPHLGPGPAMGSFVSTQELATAPVMGGQPVVADLGDFSDSMADMALV